VALVNCPECGRRISTAADACPQCGHPTRGRAAAPRAGPPCYACPAPATTRCQSCGALSCAQHVDPIFVSHGKGGANELRCSSCYRSAAAWAIIFPIIAVVAVVVWVTFAPQWFGPGGRFR